MTDLKPTPAQFRAYLLAHDWEHRHNGLNGDEHWWHPATADYMDESYSWPPDDPDPIGGGMIEVIADKEGRCQHEVLADMLGEMDMATALARIAELEAERDGEPQWRYRAFGPDNEIVLDPGGGERWAMTELGGWHIERQPIYSGPWGTAPDLVEGGDDA
jgi:hypothetical protein